MTIGVSVDQPYETPAGQACNLPHPPLRPINGTRTMTERARRRGTFWGVVILACVNALLWAFLARF